MLKTNQYISDFTNFQFSLRKEPITARSSHRPSQNWRVGFIQLLYYGSKMFDKNKNLSIEIM